MGNIGIVSLNLSVIYSACNITIRYRCLNFVYATELWVTFIATFTCRGLCAYPSTDPLMLPVLIIKIDPTLELQQYILGVVILRSNI
jgi:hypothetical protein